MAELNLVGDPTNPNPKKPKSQTLDEQMDLGVSAKSTNTYGTEHDSYLPTGQLGSKYDGNYSTPTNDLDTQRDRNQPWGDKAANALVKAAGLAGTTAAGTFTSLPFGIAGAVVNVAQKRANGLPIDARDFDPIFSNPIMDQYNKWNDELEESHKNYASQEEKDAPALSFQNVFTPNFLFDKIIKNAGFTAGAVVSGKLVGGMLMNASKLIAGGAFGVEKVAEVESLMAQGVKLPQALEKVGKAMQVGQKVSQYTATGIMAAGEAQFEANDAFNQAGVSLEAQYRDSLAKQGQDPNRELLPFEKEEIHKRKSAIGLSVMGMNMAILGLSDTIQFGSSLTKGFKTEAQAMRNTMFRGGKEVADEVTKGERWLNRAHTFGEGMVSEGWEEGAQNFAQKSALDYYSRKKDMNAKSSIDDLLHSTVYGIGQTVGTKEGLESMLLGAVTGIGSHIVMSGASGELGHEWNKVDNEYDATNAALNAMREHAEKSGLLAKYEGAIRTQSIQQSMNDAVKDGNMFLFQNLKNDRVKSLAHTYIEANRMGVLMQKLDDLKGMDNTEFMEAFGVDDLDNKSVAQYVDNFKNNLSKQASLWNKINTDFTTSPNHHKVQAWSTLSDIEDRVIREKQLADKFLKKGVSYQTFLTKNEGDVEAAEKEFRTTIAEKFKEEGEGDVSSKDVDDYFQIKADKAEKVATFEAMKKGEGFIEEEQSKTPETEEVEEEDPTEDEEPEEEAPTPKKKKAPVVAGTTKSGLSPLAHQMLQVFRKFERGETLTQEEKIIKARYQSAQTEEDEKASDEAGALHLQHENAKTLDQLDTLLADGDEDDSGDDSGDDVNKKFSVQEIADKLANEEELTEAEEAFRKKNAKAIEANLKNRKTVGLLDSFNGAFNKIWGTSPRERGLRKILNKNGSFSVSAKVAAEVLASYAADIQQVRELGQQIAESDSLSTTAKKPYITDKTGKVAQVEDLVATIQEYTKKIVPTQAKPVVYKKNKPVRVVAKDIIGLNEKGHNILAYMNDKIKSFYSKLNSAGENILPNINGVQLTPVTPATVVYAKTTKRETFDVFVGEGKNKTKIGYFPVIAKNLQKNYNADLMKLNNSVLEEARSKGSVQVQVKWNYGLNNIETSKRSTLADSVLADSKKRILRITDAGNTVLDMDTSEESEFFLPDDEARDRFKDMGLSDNYIMEIEAPNGTTQYVGLTGVAAKSASDFKKFSSLLAKGNRDELRKNFWLAAARNTNETTPPFSTTFVQQDGKIMVKVSTNRIFEGSKAAENFPTSDSFQNVATLTIPEDATFSNQQEFIAQLKPLAARDAHFLNQTLGISEVKDLFAPNPIRKEVTPGKWTADEFQLSLNPEQPWEVTAEVTSMGVIPTKVTPTSKPKVVVTSTSSETPEVTAKDKKAIVPELNPEQLGRPSRRFGQATTPIEDDDTSSNNNEESYSPFKVATGAERVQANFNKIRARLEKILPKNIKIEHMRELMNGLYENSEVMGAFVKNLIYLADSIEAGTEYHEAFHAIFRTAFTAQHKAFMLQVASQVVDTTPQAIADFKASRPEYEVLTDQQAKERILEEALADMFQGYMVKRDSTNKILLALKDAFKWLRSLLGFAKGHKDVLDDIFSMINHGDFVNREASDASGELVFKTLKGLSTADSSDLVRTVVVNIFHNKIDVTDKEAIAKLIDTISNRTDILNAIEPYRKEVHNSKVAEGLGFVENGLYKPMIFDDYPAIIKEVNATLSHYGIKIDTEAGNDLDDEDQHIKELAFDDNPFETTMFGNLPQEIRNMLLATGIEENTDDLVIPISVLGSYAQLKRLLAGEESYADMLATLALYKDSNKEIGAIYAQLEEKASDEYFQASFRNAFTMEYADSNHIQVDSKKKEFTLYASNRQDEAQILIERWKKSYEALSVKQDIPALKRLATAAKGELSKITKQLREKAKDINVTDLQVALNAVGINLSQSLITNSIQGIERLSLTEKYPYYQKEGPSFRNDLEEILKQMESEGNIFANTENEGALSRLTNLATADARHRNDIYQTSFRNAEGKSQQSYTKPTYELVKARHLQEGKIPMDKYAGSYLVDTIKKKAGEKFDNKIPLLVSIFGGVREVSKDEGITAKHIDPKSKLLAMHIAYSEGYLNVAVHESKTTEIQINVGDVLGTRNRKTNGKSNGVVYDSFIDKFADFGEDNYSPLNELALESYNYMVQKDVQRIEQVLKELKNKNLKAIEDYHFKGKGTKGYVNGKPQLPTLSDRATFPNGLKLLQFSRLQTKAEEIFDAQEEKDWLKAVKEATTDINDILQEEHQAMTKDYAKVLLGQGIDFVKNRAMLMGNRAKQYKNMNQFLSDYVAGNLIMTHGYMELIRGDEAKYLGPIDITKRAAGLVASGTSVGKGSTKFQMLADSLKPYDSGIERLPKEDKVNYTDAQSHGVPTTWIKYQKGLGKLDAESHRISTKRATGEALTDKEINYMLDHTDGTPMKMVGFDGNTYWKTSVFTIWPDMIYELNESTNRYEGKVKKGFEGIAQLYQQMLDSKTDIVAYESAIKLGRRDKQFTDTNGKHTFTEENGFTMDNQHIRLQVENPGGKDKITLGTQLMQLIDSELEENDAQGNPILLNVNGKEMSIRDIRQNAQNILSELTNSSFNKITKLFDSPILKANGNEENLMWSTMAATAKASGGSDVEQEYYAQDSQGNLILSANLPSMVAKHMQSIMSYYNKNILSKKIPGLKLTLVSSEGFKNPQTGEDLKIHRLANGKIELAECLISQELLWQKGLRAETDKTGRFIIYRAGDKNKTRLSEETVQEILSMLGFRIPTQSHHSMMPFKVVGFLPALQSSSIVVPGALAHLAGSDYDVDSLFVNRKEFYVDSEGNLQIYGQNTKIEEGDTAQVIAAKNKKAYQEWYQTELKDNTVKELLKKVEVYTDARNRVKNTKAAIRVIRKQRADAIAKNKMMDELHPVFVSTEKSAKFNKEREERKAINRQTVEDAKAKLEELNAKLELAQTKEEAEYQRAIEYTFKSLKLPTSQKEWERTKPRSKYAATNELLDMYMAMMVNPHNAESIFTPASMASIAFIGESMNAVYDISENSPFPYNYTGNLFNHWKANRSEIVGPAANASKVSAFFSKNKVRLFKAINLGDVTSEGYASNHEVDIDLDRIEVVENGKKVTKLVIKTPIKTQMVKKNKARIKTREMTPDNLTTLPKDSIFVFGSNGEGRHGKGAAADAKKYFGAIQGQAEGLQGQSYAIVTKKDFRKEKSSSLEEIGNGIIGLLRHASMNPNQKFYVTKIGSSLAGYSEEEIKDLFQDFDNQIPIPDNVILPQAYEVRKGEREITEKQVSGGLTRRKADSLSSLVSAMTDNAKERLAVKLNLTVDNITVFGNMLALGFGMNRTMLFANQPILRQLSRRIMEAKAHIDGKESNWELADKMLERLASILGDKNLLFDMSFSDQDLVDFAQNSTYTTLNKFRGKDDKHLKASASKGQELTPEERKVFEMQYKVLAKYQELQKVTDYVSASNRILNTNKGVGITGEDIDKFSDDVDKFGSDNLDKPFHFPWVNSIAKNADVILGNVDSLDERLTREFIARSIPARTLQKELKAFGRMNDKMRKSFHRGFLSQLSMMQINKALRSRSDNGPKSLEGYSYLINETEDEEKTPWTQQNIVNQYNFINQQYAKPNSALARNPVWQALIPRKGNEANPFYRIEFNTNMKIDAQYKEDLISGMKELYAFGDKPNHPVRLFANNLYLALALKDSLEYRNSSPIGLMPPKKFEHVGKFLEQAKLYLGDDTSFENFTGIKYFQFEQEFLNKWVKQPSNRKGWKAINIGDKSVHRSKDGNKLSFNAENMDEETFSTTFMESRMPIKNDKGFITWPRILDSGDDVETESGAMYHEPELWVRSFVKGKYVEYTKVNLDNFNPLHSPYSVSTNFVTTKPVEEEEETVTRGSSKRVTPTAPETEDDSDDEQEGNYYDDDDDNESDEEKSLRLSYEARNKPKVSTPAPSSTKKRFGQASIEDIEATEQLENQITEDQKAC